MEAKYKLVVIYDSGIIEELYYQKLTELIKRTGNYKDYSNIVNISAFVLDGECYVFDGYLYQR